MTLGAQTKNRLQNEPSVILRPSATLRINSAKDLLLDSRKADSSGCALRMTTHFEANAENLIRKNLGVIHG
jgi:hypothetical protein